MGEKTNDIESDDEAKLRFLRFFNEIINQYENKRILIVSHGALIRLAQDVIEQKTLERDRVGFCDIITYDKNNNKEIIKLSAVN